MLALGPEKVEPEPLSIPTTDAGYASFQASNVREASELPDIQNMTLFRADDSDVSFLPDMNFDDSITAGPDILKNVFLKAFRARSKYL